MRDPWNAEKKELKEWAYDYDAPWPTQDFDLAVAEMHFADLIVELASDNQCPKRQFFLQCAYLIVGDAVRTKYETSSNVEIERFLNVLKSSGNNELSKLCKRAEILMKNPSSFDYDLWCDGGYIRRENRS